MAQKHAYGDAAAAEGAEMAAAAAAASKSAAAKKDADAIISAFTDALDAMVNCSMQRH